MSDLDVYTSVMKDLAAGKAVSSKRFAAATEFAKAKKRKRPVMPDTVEKAAKAPKEKAAPKTCSKPGCDLPALAKGLCSKDYTAWRRTDPVVMEKAREASRAYAARVRAAKTTDA